MVVGIGWRAYDIIRCENLNIVTMS